MTPELAPEQLRKPKAWEYVVRFVFGGAVTTGAGVIVKVWGPGVGGLFLAFPAILPASLTLVKQHEGRAMAADDARGACLGSVALALFAVTVLFTASALTPPLVLSVASLVWCGAAFALWFGRYHNT